MAEQIKKNKQEMADSNEEEGNGLITEGQMEVGQ